MHEILEFKNPSYLGYGIIICSAISMLFLPISFCYEHLYVQYEYEPTHAIEGSDFFSSYPRDLYDPVSDFSWREYNCRLKNPDSTVVLWYFRQAKRHFLLQGDDIPPLYTNEYKERVPMREPTDYRYVIPGTTIMRARSFYENAGIYTCRAVNDTGHYQDVNFELSFRYMSKVAITRGNRAVLYTQDPALFFRVQICELVDEDNPLGTCLRTMDANFWKNYSITHPLPGRRLFQHGVPVKVTNMREINVNWIFDEERYIPFNAYFTTPPDEFVPLLYDPIKIVGVEPLVFENSVRLNMVVSPYKPVLINSSTLELVEMKIRAYEDIERTKVHSIAFYGNDFSCCDAECNETFSCFSVVFRCLPGGQRYYFTVAINYGEFYGLELELMWFNSSFMPTDPVAEIRIDSVTSSSISVGWKPPSDGKAYRYDVSISNSEYLKELAFEPERRFATLDSLLPDTLYDVLIAVYMHSDGSNRRHIQPIRVRTLKHQGPTNVKEKREEYRSVWSLYNSASSRRQIVDEEINQLRQQLSPETDSNSTEGSGDSYSEDEEEEEQGHDEMKVHFANVKTLCVLTGGGVATMLALNIILTCLCGLMTPVRQETKATKPPKDARSAATIQSSKVTPAKALAAKEPAKTTGATK